jgi:putative heme-binding domain-containing protein
MALATGDRGALAKLVNAVVPADAANPTVAAMEGFATFLDKVSSRRTTIEKLGESDDALGARLKSAGALFETARRIVADSKAPANLRAASVALLGRQPEARAEDLKLIPALLSPQSSSEIQLAAVRAAARTGDAGVASTLLAGWANHSPAVRTAIADALLPREAWALELARSAAARDLDFSRRQRLLNHASAKVKEAAKATLAQSAVSADRQKVIDAYRSSLTLAGDAKHGQALYGEHCATCHRVGGAAVGHDIGPNLLTVRDWPRENLLAAILDPDRTVEPRFIAYAATLSDSTTLTGLLTAESAGNITIKTLDDVDHAVPRAGLKSLVSTSRSLMPQGFEAAMGPQDLADLMAFVQSPGTGGQ